MDDDFDAYDCIDYPTREEEKAAEIALAYERRLARAELATPQPGHTELCEGCRGSGAGYEYEYLDDDTLDVLTDSYEDCPECGGCGYYDCDGTCEVAQDPEAA